MFSMYHNQKRVMVLSYKPSLHDVVKNDDTDTFYEVIRIEGKIVHCQLTTDPRIFV